TAFERLREEGIRRSPRPRGPGRRDAQGPEDRRRVAGRLERRGLREGHAGAPALVAPPDSLLGRHGGAPPRLSCDHASTADDAALEIAAVNVLEGAEERRCRDASGRTGGVGSWSSARTSSSGWLTAVSRSWTSAL